MGALGAGYLDAIVAVHAILLHLQPACACRGMGRVCRVLGVSGAGLGSDEAGSDGSSRPASGSPLPQWPSPRRPTCRQVALRGGVELGVRLPHRRPGPLRSSGGGRGAEVQRDRVPPQRWRGMRHRVASCAASLRRLQQDEVQPVHGGVVPPAPACCASPRPWSPPAARRQVRGRQAS